MSQRVRHSNDQYHLGSQHVTEFLNPFSYMSSDEARVTLELYNRNVPFTYRWFDGDAPTLKALVPDFAPEFTLSDYKVVITVQGGYFGTLPGVLDKTALAKVALEHDGWKVIILWEQDIIHNLVDTLNREFPASMHPTITGGEKPSPYALPHWMFTRRQFLRGLSLLRTRFNPKKVDSNARSHRRKFLRERVTGNGRTRSLLARYRQDAS